MVKESIMQVIIPSYFAFTTLSTVGFGDYYPISNLERLMGSFVLLSGVSLFSYIMGELMEMIRLLETIDKDFRAEKELDKFFQTFKKFNCGKPLKPKLISDITKFLKVKWVNDKNNFLMTPKDFEMFT